jgi:hypothetical protein
MKKVLISVFALGFVYWVSVAGAFPLPHAFAGQGKSRQHAHGKATQGQAESPEPTPKAQSKKTDDTGVPRAEEVANPEGVTRGLEKAETKQATHDTKAATASHTGERGKHVGKGKTKNDR